MIECLFTGLLTTSLMNCIKNSLLFIYIYFSPFSFKFSFFFFSVFFFFFFLVSVQYLTIYFFKYIKSYCYVSCIFQLTVPLCFCIFLHEMQYRECNIGQLKKTNYLASQFTIDMQLNSHDSSQTLKDHGKKSRSTLFIVPMKATFVMSRNCNAPLTESRFVFSRDISTSRYRCVCKSAGIISRCKRQIINIR